MDSGQHAQYYPLVFTSFWVERHLWGLHPLGYHLVNVALHAGNAWLVWTLARRLGLRGAWLLAALFALHPVHVESVAWITERKNVLSGFLTLLAALCWLRFDDADERAREPEGRPGERRGLWYGAALGAFGLALLAKTVACSLPVTLILISVWRGRRLDRRRLASLVPFFAVGLVLALQTAWIERVSVGADGAVFDFSPLERLLIASRAVAFYAGKLLVPWPLIFLYPRQELRPAELLSWLPLALELALAGLAWRAFRRGRRGPALALAVFVVTLFPALGFVNVYPMRFSFVADHFQYLASLAPLALLAAALATHVPGRARTGLGAAWLLLLGSLTWRHAQDFEDAERLWRATTRANPGAWMAHGNLAKLLSESGRNEEALERLSLALAARPDARAEEQIRLNRGMTLVKLGRNQEALAEYQRLHLERGGLEGKLAQVLERLGRDEEAEALYRQAVARDGDEARVPFGVHLLRRGRAAEAREVLAAFVANHPEDADALMFLADACAGAGETEPALEAARRALALVEARNDARTAARIRGRMGQYESSRR